MTIARKTCVIIETYSMLAMESQYAVRKVESVKNAII